MDIKIPIDQLEKVTGYNDRFTHPGFRRKLPKNIVVCDYDKNEQLIEVEYLGGHRTWFNLRGMFGELIFREKIFVIYPDKSTESLSIVAIAEKKLKRTLFVELIFEKQ